MRGYFVSTIQGYDDYVEMLSLEYILLNPVTRHELYEISESKPLLYYLPLLSAK